ncbi:2-C-methyl-D-erythritol 4-phosphate cytidylyltransferase [Granulicoccus sp. GXG6511]|uniref:2-C-methyl-D-erythritol 4-phosphate cytidylyltransferase n=1 Tax=Granulicoccus sp. GXG6511 TaxID=3381351 RepID=UPI003D7D2C88
MKSRSDDPVVALVAAAGSGSRLGGEVPKALRPLAGVPLVAHSLARLAAGGVERAVVVVADGLQPDFERALSDAPIPWQLVIGGSERQHSVRRGLDLIGRSGPAEIVLVHDAARPMVPPSVVAAVIAAVRAGHVAVVPALPVVDSIRRVDSRGTADGSIVSEVVDRAPLRAVQTPQGFAYATLVAAHDHVARLGLEVTDDAACCEAIGESVHLVPGSRLAMKVTEPTDMVVAEALLAAFGEQVRRS